MSEFLNTLLRDIHSGEILALIEELEHACPVVSREALTLPLVGFLRQCVYPTGPGERVPISTALAIDAPILESRVGKLPDGNLRDLCAELARLHGTALEFHQGSKVYVLLNKTLPKYAAPKKPTARQGRWDAVNRQRRSNR